MEIEFPYALSDDDARARLLLLGEYLMNRHGIRVTWINDSTASFSGKYLVVKIDGELTLGKGLAQFKGEDPGFLWRSKAKDYIKGKLATYLDPQMEPSQLRTS